MTSRSKSLSAFTSAFTTCIVVAGSTLRSSSPTVSRSLPVSLFAWVTLLHAAYSGPTGQPIHCSFHQTLSIRLSWQPQSATATL
jgi:hypothetical protein